MKIYKRGVNSITLGGATFTADEQGIIDVPDHLASHALLTGYVNAKGRLAQIANENADAPADGVAAAIAAPSPVEKIAEVAVIPTAFYAAEAAEIVLSDGDHPGDGDATAKPKSKRS